MHYPRFFQLSIQHKISTTLTHTRLLWLLTDNMIRRGGNTKFIGRHKGLGIFSQSTKHGNESSWHERTSKESKPRIVGTFRVNQGTLMSTNGGIFRQDYLEASCLHGLFNLLITRIIDGSNKGHGALYT